MVYNPNKFCARKIKFLYSHQRNMQGSATASKEGHSQSPVLMLFCIFTCAFYILTLYLLPATIFLVEI